MIRVSPAFLGAVRGFVARFWVELAGAESGGAAQWWGGAGGWWRGGGLVPSGGGGCAGRFGLGRSAPPYEVLQRGGGGGCAGWREELPSGGRISSSIARRWPSWTGLN